MVNHRRNSRSSILCFSDVVSESCDCLTATCNEVWPNLQCKTLYIFVWHHRCIFTMLFLSMPHESHEHFGFILQTGSLLQAKQLSDYLFLSLRSMFMLHWSGINSMYGWVIGAYITVHVISWNTHLNQYVHVMSCSTHRNNMGKIHLWCHTMI